MATGVATRGGLLLCVYAPTLNAYEEKQREREKKRSKTLQLPSPLLCLPKPQPVRSISSRTSSELVLDLRGGDPGRRIAREEGSSHVLGGEKRNAFLAMRHAFF